MRRALTFGALLAAGLGLSAGAMPALSLVPQPLSVHESGGLCPTSAVVRYETDKSIVAEGYRLDVSSNGVVVVSADAAGRLYAQMTLEQLKNADGYPCVRIEDRPAFRWRGLLIDESRHFFGKEVILQTLELMAFHKLNVLHWHLTDDQGWRIDVPGLPELVKYGSVRPESPKRFAEFKEYDGYRYEAEMNGEPYGPFFYTEKDLREVVARAKELNITVVPEVDLPGHFRGALAAYPELCCFPENISPRAARSLWGISTDVLCVGNDKSVALIGKILDYVCDVFPSEVIHIGGDECPRLNWEKCAKCRARMKAEGLKTSGELQDWITRKAIAVLARRGRRAMGWDEMLGSGDLPRTVVGQSWRGAADEGVEIELVNGATGAKRGYDMVVNPHRECYYNYKQGLPDDPYPYSGHTVTLQAAYAFDPLKGVPSDCRAHILGSEACLWAEFITTADELAWKTWPRTCAMAEVLWTGAAKGVYADFARRLAEHRRRLARKGVNCAPVGMTVGESAGSPVKVIFDTDMFTDFDDAGALACLHAYADAGQCEILATISCTRGCHSVAVCEVINAFYGRPDIPVGCTKEIEISRHGLMPRHVFRYGEAVKKYAKWVKHPISDSAPDANDVYRRVLAAQPDGSVVICSVGFLTNLRRLLETKPDAISPMDGRTLVARKVRRMVSMACRHPTGWEYNSGTDGASSKIVLDQWPTPIVYTDWNLGIDLFAGRAVADSGMKDNPIVDIFTRSLDDPAALKGKPEHGWGKAGRAAWDETAVLIAVEGAEKYFNVERGAYRIVDDKGNDVWTPDPQGRDCRVTEKLPKAEVGKVIDGLMCRGPR